MATIEKRELRKFTTIEMELILSEYLDFVMNLIVPNVSWGMGMHECDLLKLTPSGYASEIEIKVSKADLIKDKEKRHKHDHRKIKHLFFAIPYYLEKYIEHIPDRAGIIIVYESGVCRTVRDPMIHSNYVFSIEERFKLARLGSIRTWSLKKKIKRMKEGF